MNLVDRYVYDVTRRLPEKQRGDVGKELRAEIEAMIDDEAASKKPIKKHIYTVLLKMGDPAELADRYQDRQRYIIGPVYYGMYVQLLKMLMLIVIPIILFFTFTGRLASVNESMISAIFHTIGAGLEVGVHIFFWVSVSFFLVERYVNIKQSELQTWTPDQLPKLPNEQHITKTDAMLGIAWSVVAVWATAMQIPDVHRLFASDVPLFFSPAMWPNWTLALLLLSIVSLATETMKLIIGGWTRTMVAVITVTNFIVITYFLSLIAFVKPVANPEFTSLIGRLLSRPDVASGVDMGIKIFVASVVLISLYEIFTATKSYMMSKKEDK